MSDLFWLTDEQIERLRPLIPKSALVFLRRAIAIGDAVVPRCRTYQSTGISANRVAQPKPFRDRLASNDRAPH